MRGFYITCATDGNDGDENGDENETTPEVYVLFASIASSGVKFKQRI